ncbi:MAG: CRISPR-associated endonuclease Cas1 [Chloroherpetonaceae bacterium]|nr:CRISPR-associated endonuclease Cas1 [Chloroherpetonaceae bacterium]
MGWLYSQIILEETLSKAWQKVSSNDGRPGVGGFSIDQFSEKMPESLRELHHLLQTGRYKAQALLKMVFQKPDGKERILLIPTVPDRIVQTAATIVLNPILEEQLSKSSFAYRPGLSRLNAADEIEKLRNEGYLWALDADITRFFDSVEHDLILARFQEFFPDDDLLFKLISEWLKADIVYGSEKRIPNPIGLPQGAPISPLLANLYLDKLDKRLEAENFKIIRYADDFLVLCKSKPQAEEALKLTESVLAELKLNLHPEKTRITHFSEGFKYLGYLFIRSLVLPTKMHGEKWYDKLGRLKLRKVIPKPPYPEADIPDEYNHPESHFFNLETDDGKKIEVTEATLLQTEFGQKLLENFKGKPLQLDDFLSNLQKREDELEETKLNELKKLYSPFLRTLYLQEQGSLLRKEGERFLVEKSSMKLTELHARKVEQIIVLGNVTLTTPAIQHCLQNHIPIAYLSQNGYYFGRLEATTADNTLFERDQYLRSLDEEFCFDLARRMISTKISNSRTMIQRRKTNGWGNLPEYREHIETSLVLLNELAHKAERTDSFDSLRGYEGKAAAVYFDIFGLHFKRESVFFQPNFRRVKRPPTDPVNSLLSFSYTLLHSNLYSLCKIHGLSPYFGFFHTEERGNPALINDLIEEFRCVMDSLVIYTLNRGLIKNSDFYYQKDGSGCFLSNEGRKRYLEIFENRMAEESVYKIASVKLNFRRIMEAQVKQVKAVIAGKRPFYEPYSLPF